MNRTYEDMSKEELITLVTRLAKQHDEWSAEANQLRERLLRAYDWAENAVNGNDSAMMDYTEYVCGDD
jgi:hypothetical protein